MATVKIPVVRVGDASKVSVVRVHTKDGSAISGEDYYPISQGTGVFNQVWLNTDICAQLCSFPPVRKKEGIGREKAKSPLNSVAKRSIFRIVCKQLTGFL